MSLLRLDIVTGWDALNSSFSGYVNDSINTGNIQSLRIYCCI